MRHRISIVWFALLLQLSLSGTTMADTTDSTNMKPTPEMIHEAKLNPNGWVYVIEGDYGSKDAISPEAIAGAWKVDSTGNIIQGSFLSNPKFK